MLDLHSSLTAVVQRVYISTQQQNLSLVHVNQHLLAPGVEIDRGEFVLHLELGDFSASQEIVHEDLVVDRCSCEAIAGGRDGDVCDAETVCLLGIFG